MPQDRSQKNDPQAAENEQMEAPPELNDRSTKKEGRTQEGSVTSQTRGNTHKAEDDVSNYEDKKDKKKLPQHAKTTSSGTRTSTGKAAPDTAEQAAAQDDLGTEKEASTTLPPDAAAANQARKKSSKAEGDVSPETKPLPQTSPSTGTAAPDTRKKKLEKKWKTLKMNENRGKS